MKKSVTGLFLTTLIGVGLISGCASEPVGTNYPGQYNPYQQQQPYGQAQYGYQQQPYGQAQYGYQQQPYDQAQYGYQQQTGPAPVNNQLNNTQAATAPATKTTTSKTTSATTAKTAAKTTSTATTTIDPSLSIEKKILMKTKQNYDKLNSFSATFSMFSKRNDRVAPKASPLLTAETKYIFESPRKSVFTVIKHSIGAIAGAKMVWTGGDKLKVKAGGVLGLFPLELPLDDAKATTNREWRLDQLDHVSMLERALSPKATLKLAGKTTINGKEVYMIKQTGNTLEAEITEENIAVDTKDFYVVANEMYSGKDLVFQIKINMEAVNVPIPADAYEL